MHAANALGVLRAARAAERGETSACGSRPKFSFRLGAKLFWGLPVAAHVTVFVTNFFQQLFRCCPRLGLPPMSPHSFGRAGRALSDSSCHRTLLSFFIVLEHLQEALGVAPTAARRMSCTCCRTQGGEPQGSRSRRWWSPGTQQFDPLLARLRLRRLLDGHRTFDLLLVLRDAAASSCVSSGGTTETARDFTLAPLLFASRAASRL